MIRTYFLKLVLAWPLLLAGLLSAVAQDRSGNDTASDWVAKHYASFGLWDSVCDERMEADALKQRCYLRYVEVFSPRPLFMASFVFVTAQDKETFVELGFERGVRYGDSGFRVERQGETVWRATDRCLDSSPCKLTGAAAQDMLSHMSQGDMLIQQFVDRSGQNRLLTWDLTKFADALADYRSASEARDLL